MDLYLNVPQEEVERTDVTDHTQIQDASRVSNCGHPLPDSVRHRRAAIVILAVTAFVVIIAVAKPSAWLEALHSEETSVKDPADVQRFVANTAIQSTAPVRQEKQSWDCVTGPGSGCKTCVARFSRTSSMDCSSCNEGYQLHQDTQTCKTVTCAEFACPSYYVVQNAASTTLSIANCCREDPTKSKKNHMQQECSGENCCECGGHFNSLVGGGHTEDQCKEACLFHTHCTHAALSDGGYCHWFAGCTGTGLCDSPWIKWKKVVGTTTTTTLDGIEFLLSPVGMSCSEQRLMDVHSKAVCHGAAATAIGRGGSQKLASPSLDSPFGCYLVASSGTIGFNEHFGWNGVDPVKQYICMKATRSSMIDYCTESDCGECSGPYVSLIGGKHSADECKKACLANSTCFHAAFSGYGFCHMFGRLCCNSAAVAGDQWTVWKKLEATSVLDGSMGFHGLGLTKAQVEKAAQKALAKALGVDELSVKAHANEFRRLREGSDDRKLLGTGNWKVTFSVAAQAEHGAAVTAKVRNIQSNFGLIAGIMKSELMQAGVPATAAAVTFTTFNGAMETTTTITTTSTTSTTTTSTTTTTTIPTTTMTTIKTVTTIQATSTHKQTSTTPVPAQSFIEPSPLPSPTPTPASSSPQKGCSVRKRDSLCNSSPGSWAYENCPSYTEEGRCKGDYCCVWSE